MSISCKRRESPKNIQASAKCLFYGFELELNFILPHPHSRVSDAVEANGEDTSSSEEEREEKKTDVNIADRGEEPNTQGNFQKKVTNSEVFRDQLNGPNHYCSDDDEDDSAIAEHAVPTIYFSHTVEPKRVCIARIVEFILWRLLNYQFVMLFLRNTLLLLHVERPGLFRVLTNVVFS